MQSLSLSLARQFLGSTLSVVIDRPIGSTHPKHGFIYEANYGYVEGTRSADGESLDAYYLAATKPLQRVSGRCIAIVHREEEDDDKHVVVPKDIELSDDEIKSAVHFQERWFKWTIVR